MLKLINAVTGSTTKWIIFLCVVVVAVYIPVYQNSFINFDDDWYVYNNPFLNGTIANCFSNLYFGQYSPIAMSTVVGIYKMFGSDAVIYHFFGVLIHLTNAILVFVFIRKLTRNEKLAGLCSLLFAVHPVCVEAVVWAAAIKVTMFTLFSLLCFLGYAVYQERGTMKWERSTNKSFQGQVSSQNYSGDLMKIPVFLNITGGGVPETRDIETAYLSLFKAKENPCRNSADTRVERLLKILAPL